MKEEAGLNVYESYSSTINYSNENNEIWNLKYLHCDQFTYADKSILIPLVLNVFGILACMLILSFDADGCVLGRLLRVSTNSPNF